MASDASYPWHASGARPDRGRRLRLAPIVAAGLVATLAAAAFAVTGVPGDNAALAALGRASTVAVPIGVGAYAWYRRPAERFGPLLIAAGFGAFLATPAESSDGALYSLGRVAGWGVEVGLIYLILAFPSGRLEGRVDRALVAAAALLALTLYLPTALLVEEFPVPNQYTSCVTGCPGNAFLLVGSEPGWVGSVVIPLRELLSILAVRRGNRQAQPARSPGDPDHAAQPNSGLRGRARPLGNSGAGAQRAAAQP